MIFINLGKLRKKPAKEDTDRVAKIVEEERKKGIKFLGSYWTLGRYDSVVIIDAPNEKKAMRVALRVADVVSTETLVAVPRDEAVKLI